MEYFQPSRIIQLDDLTQQDELYIVGCADPGNKMWRRDSYPSDKAWLVIMTVLANSPYATQKQCDAALSLIEKYKQETTTAMKRRLCKQRRAAFKKDRDEKKLALIARGDQAICSECGTADDLTIDHIIPLSRGGTDVLENLQFLCRPCNSKKNDRVSPEVLEGLDDLELQG